MKVTLIAIALAAAVATAVPILAKSADDPDTLYAQAAPPAGRPGAAGGGPEEREGGRWPMMHGMMHRMHGMMRRDPQQWCLDRLARRAATRAYVGVKLNLTPEQQPLWDKVQNAAQAEEQQERQLCASLKPGVEPSLLERMDRMQQFLQARLNGLQATRPAVQTLYQSLTPEQQAILNHPHPFGGR